MDKEEKDIASKSLKEKFEFQIANAVLVYGASYGKPSHLKYFLRAGSSVVKTNVATRNAN